MKPTQAQALAERAHTGQLYGDRPYIEHVKDVAWRVSRDPRSTPDALVVAWLHDVVEDGHMTNTQLIGEHGLAGAQARALSAITKREGESYDRYLSRACKDRIAALVKLHDIQSNLAAGPTGEKKSRYERALPLVRDALLGVVYCKSRACRAPIVYLKTRSGRYMPVNRASLPEAFDHERLLFDANLGHESHYATCPEAKRFRRAR